MPLTRIFGIVLLVIGVGVLGFAIHQSDSFLDQSKMFFTGNFRDKTMWMFLGGAVAALVGLGSCCIPSSTLPRALRGPDGRFLGR